MIINHNLPGANAISRMNANAATASKSMQKLSSGLRINTAGDDAAGLAISEKMRGQIRGLDQASANAQDGISMVQTAEGALNETHSILQRMKELATQASNDTNTTGDRKEIQKEMNQLTSEINRIGNTTEFNTQKLLKGGAASGAVGTVSNITGVAGNAGGTKGTTTLTISTALAAGDTIHVGGETITVYDTDANLQSANNVHGISLESSATKDEQATAIAAMTFTGITTDNSVAGAVTFKQTVNGTGDTTAANVDGVNNGGAAAASATIAGVAADSGTPGSTTFTITTALKDGDTLAVGGETITTYADSTALAAANGGTGDAFGIVATDTAAAQATAIKAMTFTDVTTGGTGAQVSLTQTVAGTGDVTAPIVTPAAGTGFNRTLQIGANQDQSFNVQINDMRASVLGVSGTAGATAAGVDATDAVTGATFAAIANTDELTDNSGTTEYALDVTDNTKASAAIKVVDQAIASVSSERSKLGAYSNRLEHTIANLGTSSENLTSAESRIRDVDMAKEMSTFSKNNILSQAAQAMLAQANTQPQQVLQLLR